MDGFDTLYTNSNILSTTMLTRVSYTSRLASHRHIVYTKLYTNSPCTPDSPYILHSPPIQHTPRSYLYTSPNLPAPLHSAPCDCSHSIRSLDLHESTLSPSTSLLSRRDTRRATTRDLTPRLVSWTKKVVCRLLSPPPLFPYFHTLRNSSPTLSQFSLKAPPYSETPFPLQIRVRANTSKPSRFYYSQCLLCEKNNRNALYILA